MLKQQAIFALVAIFAAGTLVFSDAFGQLVVIFYPYFLFSTFNLLLASQIGFSYDIIQVKNHQDQITTDLNPWNGTVYITMICLMIAGVAVYGYIFIRFFRGKKDSKKARCCWPS